MWINLRGCCLVGGWDHGIGVAVLETHKGDHVYIRMLYNGEDVVHSDAKGKTPFFGMKTVLV